MSIDKWDPLNEFLRLRNLFNDVFDRTLQSSRSDQETLPAHIWSPVVDVYKNKNEIVINAELPGIKEDDIQITLKGDVLSIYGERPASYRNGEMTVHRLERSYGVFQREVKIPSTHVDVDAMRSSYQEGVLQIVLPIIEDHFSIQIPIKS